MGSDQERNDIEGAVLMALVGHRRTSQEIATVTKLSLKQVEKALDAMRVRQVVLNTFDGTYWRWARRKDIR